MDSDLAISNVNVKSKLEENRKVGTSRLLEVTSKYANLQETRESRRYSYSLSAPRENETQMWVIAASQSAEVSRFPRY